MLLPNAIEQKGGLLRMSVCPHPPHSADLTLLARPKVKMMAKGQCLEWSQDTKAATIAQLKTEEKDSRATVESGQKID